jgi:hypothetical protein
MFHLQEQREIVLYRRVSSIYREGEKIVQGSSYRRCRMQHCKLQELLRSSNNKTVLCLQKNISFSPVPSGIFAQAFAVATETKTTVLKASLPFH